jgi:2-oxoisovalerate dehydrogenase E1 component beta subunit
MTATTYIEAIGRGMREEMERDSSVFLMGEDIGAYGGAFKATRGFLGKFGPARVIDTPLSETAILGAAVGAALVGMRPIVEMQFADFVSCGFNQLVTNAATMHYRWHLPVPMVVRLPSGGYIHGGPFHSVNPEGWFFHVPGLKIVAPSTAEDACGLMKGAVRDNNPVLYLESKYLYRRVKGEVSGDVVEIGKGMVRRPGHDMVIITYGSTVQQSLDAADRLAREEGVETGVVDLRTLKPLDTGLILDAVRATGRVLIVHEDNLTGGIGGEVAALIAEGAFRHLDAPVRRLAALDTPVPFSPPLEEFVLPSQDKIFDALQELRRY